MCARHADTERNRTRMTCCHVACIVVAIQWRRPYHHVVRVYFLEDWSRWYLIWRQKNIHILCVHT